MEKNEAEASILGEYSKEVIKTKYISYCPVCLYEHAWDTKKEQEEMLKNWREYGLGAKVSQLRAERDEAVEILRKISNVRERNDYAPYAANLCIKWATEFLERIEVMGDDKITQELEKANYTQVLINLRKAETEVAQLYIKNAELIEALKKFAYHHMPYDKMPDGEMVCRYCQKPITSSHASRCDYDNARSLLERVRGDANVEGA